MWQFRNIKKCLSGFIVMGLLGASAYAADESVFLLRTEQKEDKIEVSVMLDSDDPVCGVQYKLFYDSEKLKLERAALQGVYKDLINMVNTKKAGEVIAAAASATTVEEQDLVMKLYFTAAAPAEDIVTFTLSEAMISDENCEPHYMDKDVIVKFDIASGQQYVSSGDSSSGQSGSGSGDSSSGQSGSGSGDSSSGQGGSGSGDSSSGQGGSGSGDSSSGQGGSGSGDSSSGQGGSGSGDSSSGQGGSGSGNSSSGQSGSGSGDSSSGQGGSGSGDSSSGQGGSVSPDSPQSVTAFTDIDGHWANSYIVKANKLGLMSGYGDGVFGPDNKLTRAQMATVLWNSKGNPKPEKPSGFTDLEKDWYKDAIAWVEQEGIFHGIGNNLFDPEGMLTREQLSQVLFNQSGKGSGLEAMLTGIYDSQYSDSGSISQWAKPALYWALYNEILCGDNSESISGSLAPKAQASRAQIAVMMVRFNDFQEKA